MNDTEVGQDESKDKKINSRIRYGGWFKKLVSSLTSDV